jgi:hypothetical protein
MASPRKRVPKQSLRLTLEAAATPERVRQVATMFEEALRQIDPQLREGDVTMVIENFSAAAEIRGWKPDGERVVRLTAELVENPIEAIQGDHRLTAAARVLAAHTAALAPCKPVFWRDGVAVRSVDDVFLRTMRAAGQPTTSADAGELTGETVVYSAVLRVGRRAEGGPVQARVILDGRPVDVEIFEGLVDHLWEAAKTGETLQMRLRGQWQDSGSGTLRLEHPTIIALDTTFAYATGRELMEEVRQHASMFSSDDFDRMLGELQPGKED